MHRMNSMFVHLVLVLLGFHVATGGNAEFLGIATQTLLPTRTMRCSMRFFVMMSLCVVVFMHDILQNEKMES